MDFADFLLDEYNKGVDSLTDIVKKYASKNIKGMRVDISPDGSISIETDDTEGGEEFDVEEIIDLGNTDESISESPEEFPISEDPLVTFDSAPVVEDEGDVEASSENNLDDGDEEDVDEDFVVLDFLASPGP